MHQKIDSFAKKVAKLNEYTLSSILEKNNQDIIKHFTNIGIEILEADFGFAWWKQSEGSEYRLAYKSANTPYDPPVPRERAGNYIARETKKPFFDSNVKRKNYAFDINKYLKSYIIIPICYREYIYGSLVFCYKKRHIFTSNETTLASAIGNSAGQVKTIHRLLDEERGRIKNHEKTRILLREEKTKVHFIRNAAHEFRTPLAIMRGNVDLALHARNLKSERSALRAINIEITHLGKILADLTTLTSSNTESNHVLHKENFVLCDFLQKIATRLRKLTVKKNITIQIRRFPEITIEADKIQIEKLFSNLIRNAITYGKPEGKIWVDIKKSGRMARVEISDNGIGIEEKDLPFIFERFYRADKAHSSGGAHSGLGLAIAKWVAEAHDGSISAQSKYGKGTTFTVLLPISK